MWLNIFAILVGYLLGSVSPAYILGRLLKGIDIRQHGTHNAGGRNVKKVLGLWPAVITIIYDFSKGLLSMLIVWKLGAPEIIIYAAGYAAILGHIFPFYLGFRGGEGQATSVAIFFYLISKTLINHWFPFEILIPVLILAGFLFIISPAEIVGAFALPAFILLFLSRTQINITTIFLAIIMIQMWIVTLYNVKKFNLLDFSEAQAKEIKFWRTILRPLAIVFPLMYLLLDRHFMLIFIGSVALAFLLLDLVRLLSKKTNLILFKSFLFKQKEVRTFSSMTMFLVAIFLSILLFPKNIAILALTFLIFGDVFAKVIGMLFGKVHIFKKTLEGSITYFLAAVIFGMLLQPYLGVSYLMLLLGALTAALIELIPWGVDDNLSVAILSGAVMYIITIF